MDITLHADFPAECVKFDPLLQFIETSCEIEGCPESYSCEARASRRAPDELRLPAVAGQPPHSNASLRSLRAFLYVNAFFSSASSQKPPVPSLQNRSNGYYIIILLDSLMVSCYHGP
jgi:hypothetical protein